MPSEDSGRVAFLRELRRSVEEAARGEGVSLRELLKREGFAAQRALAKASSGDAPTQHGFAQLVRTLEGRVKAEVIQSLRERFEECRGIGVNSGGSVRGEGKDALRQKTFGEMSALWEEWSSVEAAGAKSHPFDLLELCFSAVRLYRDHVRAVPEDAHAGLARLEEQFEGITQAYGRNETEERGEDFRITAEAAKVAPECVPFLRDWTRALGVKLGQAGTT